MVTKFGYLLVVIFAAAALLLATPIVHAVVVYREWNWESGTAS